MSLKKSINSILFFDRRAIKRWSVFLTTFLIGQGAVQILQAVTGFLIIRWLSVEEYAQYSLAFAFQSTAQGLVEFGFSGAIIALVGNKINNKSIIGNYIKAGRFYRDRSFIIIAVVISIVFPLFALDHNWSWPVTCLLLVGILSNLFFSGNISYYKPVLQMHKCFRGIYKISVFTLIIRFILVYIPYLFNALNAWIAVLSTSLMTIINGRSFKKKAQSYLEEPSQSDAEVRKEMFNYIKPIIPGILFATVQAQVTKDALINQMVTLGYDESNNSTEGDSPAALGNRIANTILSFSWNDGSGEAEGYVEFSTSILVVVSPEVCDIS